MKRYVSKFSLIFSLRFSFLFHLLARTTYCSIFLYPIFSYGSECSKSVSQGQLQNTKSSIKANTSKRYATLEFLSYTKGSVSNTLASTILDNVIDAVAGANSSSLILNKNSILNNYIPDSLKYFSTALKESESLQGASLEQPRHLYFNPIEMLILGFNSFHTQKGSYSLEFLGLGKNNDLEFSEIITRSDFDLYYASQGITKEWSIKSLGFTEDEIEFFNEEILVSKANPKKCIDCHFAIVEGKKVPGFIWEPYADWKKALGTTDDLLSLADSIVLDDLYSKDSNLKRLAFKQPSYYSNKVDRNFLNMPNTQLTHLLSFIQSKSLVKYFSEDSLFSSKLIYSMTFLNIFGQDNFSKLIEQTNINQDHAQHLLSFAHFSSPWSKIKSDLTGDMPLFNTYSSAGEIRIENQIIEENKAKVGFHTISSLAGNLKLQLIQATLEKDSVLNKYFLEYTNNHSLSDLYIELKMEQILTESENGIMNQKDFYSSFRFFNSKPSTDFDYQFLKFYYSSLVLPDFSLTITNQDKEYLANKVMQELKFFLDSPKWKDLVQKF